MRILMAGMVALSLAGGSATAQQAAPPLVPEHQGDIGFVSGGTGLEDRETLRGMAGDYNLHLMFAVQPSGQYLAGVGVTLNDAKGNTVLDTVSDGPLFYAHVPPGRYRVTVTSGGKAQTRDVQIAATGRAAQAFYWRQAG